MQTLGENRWEDYEWDYDSRAGKTRFDYWGPGISFVEDPGMDPLGLSEKEALYSTTSVPSPKSVSDLSFYLWESEPLPAI